MLVVRCGWLANSAALCLISQSFAIFHRHSWCLKKIENKISLSNLIFLSLLSQRLFGIAPYSGLNLYLVPHVPSAFSSSRVSFAFLSSFTFLLGLLSLLPLMCLLSPHFLLYCLYLSILLIMKLAKTGRATIFNIQVKCEIH